MKTIALAGDESQLAKLPSLSKQLNLPIASQNDFTYDYLVVKTSSHLELREPKKASKPFYLDFTKGPLGYRRVKASKNTELIAKAVGIKKNYRPYIIDCTAGFGRDAFILARLGCKVLMLERSAIIAALLEDALLRFQKAAPNESLFLKLQCIDAKDFLLTLPPHEVEVIYLDPMFPERKKTALVKKEMQILQDIAGIDAQADSLLPLALAKATKRVVVKRPLHAPCLNEMKPSVVFSGKNIRFDVYL